MPGRPKYKPKEHVLYEEQAVVIEYRVHDPENGWRYGLLFKDGHRWQVGQNDLKRKPDQEDPCA